MKKNIALIFVTLFLSVSFASADNFRIITAEELKKMQDERKQVVIVDARTTQEYREGHLPQAITIPPEKFRDIARLLPKDKRALIVFYCRGTG